MNKIKIGRILIATGFVFWIVENFWFGWNRLPMSEAEKICDIITQALIVIGFWIYILPIWSLYENAVKKHDASLK